MSGDFSRIDRIQDLMQVELANIIQRDLSDPRLAMVTITGVTVSKDLKHARIYVNIYPDEQAKESIRTLNHASSYLRTLLAKRVVLRCMPQLRFYHDETTSVANRIHSLIQQSKPAIPFEPDDIEADRDSLDDDK